MHCCAKIWMKPIDPSIAGQVFKAINFPAGTVHMCKGLRKARAKNRTAANERKFAEAAQDKQEE